MCGHIELEKVFDEVAHSKLIHRLDFYGIRGGLAKVDSILPFKLYTKSYC